MAYEPDKEAVQRRMRLAFDLYEAAVTMQRQSLRRRHPEASEDEIRQMMAEWHRTRPGAENGDGPGRPAPHRLAQWRGTR